MAPAWLKVDAQGHLLAASTKAVDCLRVHRSLLQLRQRMLRAPQRQTELARMLALALRDGASALALPRRGRMPLTLRCEAVSAPPAPARLRLTLVDPETLAVDPALLQPMFGLTPAEATVAAGLAAGLDSDRLAQALGVKPNTVLSHVKKALTKTGTRRQGELVSLLLRSAACRATARSAVGESATPAPPLFGGAEPRWLFSLAQSGDDSARGPP